MKAIVYDAYGSPDVLELREVEKPVPGDNEVLINIAATAVTATDSIFRKGKPFISRLATGILKPKLPVLGDVLAGEVEAVGKNVKLFKKGDRVFGSTDARLGAHAEYTSLSAEGSLAIKPPRMTYQEAACMSDGGLTALPFLRDSASIKSGQHVLINGASGSVGTVAVQLAKHFGAEVTGVCSTANMELVRSLGADRIIDYTREDFTESNQTYDVIFDTVGKSSFSRCKRSLKKDGIYLTTVLGVPILLQMLWTKMVGSKKAIIAFTGLRPPREKREDLLFLNELFAAGKLTPVIDRSFPLEQIAEAHTYVDKGHKRGNVIITMDHR